MHRAALWAGVGPKRGHKNLPLHHRPLSLAQDFQPLCSFPQPAAGGSPSPHSPSQVPSSIVVFIFLWGPPVHLHAFFSLSSLPPLPGETSSPRNRRLHSDSCPLSPAGGTQCRSWWRTTPGPQQKCCPGAAWALTLDQCHQTAHVWMPESLVHNYWPANLSH